MCLPNVIGNHHVQNHGMFTIMTHFMAKHMLEDDEMLKNGLAVKGIKSAVKSVMNLMKSYKILLLLVKSC